MTVRHAPAPIDDIPLRFASVAVVAVVVGLLSTILLVSLRPSIGGSGFEPPAPPVAEPTESDEPSRTPEPTRRPSASPAPTPRSTPSPTADPTPVPTPDPTPVPPPVVTPPPQTGNVLPPCAYMDVLTPHHGYDEWPISLLDTIYHLPSWYAPSDLVDSTAAGLNGGYLVRGIIVADLRAMAADARAAGVPIQLVSGYRSHAQQQATFDYWVSVGGYEQALRTSARAGHSEHQLGTSIDVTSAGGAAPWEYADWAATPAGAWMAANAWRYGFVMSYPAGSFDRTCYDYEPWHYRYVGRAMAAEIVASGLTPREVIWTRQ